MAFSDHRPASFPGTTVPAVGAEAISYGGGDQTVSPCSRALYVATAGDLKVDMLSGDTVTFASLPAGTILAVCVKKIYQTGSNAAGIILR